MDLDNQKIKELQYRGGNESDYEEGNLSDLELSNMNNKSMNDKSLKRKSPSRLSQSYSQDSLARDSPNGDSNNDKLSQDLKENKRNGSSTSNKINNKFGIRQGESFESRIHKLAIEAEERNNDYLNLRAFKNQTNKYFYPLSAQKCAHFESMLFNLIGFSAPTFKIDEVSNEALDLKKLSDLDNDRLMSSFISNMDLLNKRVDSDSTNHLYLSKNPRRSARAEVPAADKTQNKFLKNKIVTIVLNQSARPRKAARILLNKRNTANLDTILNEVSSLFKTNYVSIRKLFKLNGTQVTDPKDLLDKESIFLAFGNDKVHNKDFDLDPDEIKILYANDFMKGDSQLSPAKIIENYKNRKTSSHSKKSAHGSEKIIDNIEDDIEFMPEELLENYEIGGVIGEGHYALVRECKDINTGIAFALKIIDLKKCKGKEEMIENELNILRKVKHSNIVKLVEEYKSKDYFYLIMEYLKEGDLLEDITRTIKYTERESSAMIHSLASAIAYLHSLNIVHRDIKLENILIHKFNDGIRSLKLGDFGLATFVKQPLNQKCGSPVYVAPEILIGKSYGLEVDIWSLGVIAYILLCGYAPFQGDSDEETLNSIKNDELKFIYSDWEAISESAKELITRMLDRNQETRIKAHEILEHKWIVNMGQEDIANEGSHVESSKLSTPGSLSQYNISMVEQLSARSRRNKNYKSSNILIPSSHDLKTPVRATPTRSTPAGIHLVENVPVEPLVLPQTNADESIIIENQLITSDVRNSPVKNTPKTPVEQILGSRTLIRTSSIGRVSQGAVNPDENKDAQAPTTPTRSNSTRKTPIGTTNDINKPLSNRGSPIKRAQSGPKSSDPNTGSITQRSNNNNANL